MKWDHLFEADARLRDAERAYKLNPDPETLANYLMIAKRNRVDVTIELETLDREMVRSTDVRQLLRGTAMDKYTYRGNNLRNLMYGTRALFFNQALSNNYPDIELIAYFPFDKTFRVLAWGERPGGEEGDDIWMLVSFENMWGASQARRVGTPLFQEGISARQVLDAGTRTIRNDSLILWSHPGGTMANNVTREYIKGPR